MNCDTVHQVLPLYLSGELEGDGLANMERHLQQCKSCAEAASMDRGLDDALRAAMLESTPDVSAVLQRVHRRMTEPWWRPKRLFAAFPLRVAAAIAVLIVVAVIAVPRFSMYQSGRNMALAAAGDHYSDLVLLRHSDWATQPREVESFMQEHFPLKQNLLPSITPPGAALEKVRLCKLDGTQYAHFVFKTGTVETSVFLLPRASGKAAPEVAHLNNGGHGLEVSGFASAELTGMVVGQQGVVSTRAIADRLAQRL